MGVAKEANDICLEELRKPQKDLRQVSECPGWDVNQAPPKYKSMSLPLCRRDGAEDRDWHKLTSIADTYLDERGLWDWARWLCRPKSVCYTGHWWTSSRHRETETLKERLPSLTYQPTSPLSLESLQTYYSLVILPFDTTQPKLLIALLIKPRQREWMNEWLCLYYYRDVFMCVSVCVCRCWGTLRSSSTLCSWFWGMLLLTVMWLSLCLRPTLESLGVYSYTCALCSVNARPWGVICWRENAGGHKYSASSY
jgi:hypothetical protein